MGCQLRSRRFQACKGGTAVLRPHSLRTHRPQPKATDRPPIDRPPAGLLRTHLLTSLEMRMWSAELIHRGAPSGSMLAASAESPATAVSEEQTHPSAAQAVQYTDCYRAQ